MTSNIDPYVANESEQSLLSLMINNIEKNKKILDMIDPSDFVSPDNQAIFRQIQRNVASKKSVDLAILGDQMADRITYLIKLSQKFASEVMISRYIEMIKAAAQRRKLYLLGQRIMDGSTAMEVGPLIENSRIQLKSFGICGKEDTGLSDVILNVHNSIYTREKSPRIAMGIPKLDGITGGFEPSALYVIGARPSVGKSVFGMIAALRAGAIGKKALIINREMPKENVVRRMLAHLSGIDLGKIKTGKMSEEEQAKVMMAYAELDNMDVHVANEPKTVAEIRESALRIYEEDGLDLLVIDYLQRLAANKKAQNRDEAIGEICWAIKDIAMDMKIPILLLSQLNRSATNNRPTMANLRESGNIEQDADVVILLHKPNDDDIESSKRSTMDMCHSHGDDYLEMIVDKNRDGRTCILPVEFQGNLMRYISL